MGPDVAETAADGAPEFFSAPKTAVQPDESLVQTFPRSTVMKYRGIINFDVTGKLTVKQKNERVALGLALVESGWLHIETSAFTRETDKVNDLWDGAILVAKLTNSARLTLSAFTFHIQSSQDFSTSIPSASTQSPANALARIRSISFP
jgi:hypothetical protein